MADDRPPATWIGDAEGLARLGERLRAEPAIALDTEADGFHHYFDKLCLLQITMPGADVLVDTLAVGSLAPLRGVLEDRAVVKVLHAAEQDLMYLRRDHDLHVAGLFDTQAAAQLCGRTRLGLAALLAEFFDVTLAKDSQRDDWSVRPLTARQLEYAITDTRWLLPLAEALRAELVSRGRLVWAEEEFRALEERSWVMQPVDPDDIARVPGWKELNPRQRRVLRELLRARDLEARRLDKPPFRVVGNATLLSVARVLPATPDDLQRAPGMPRHLRDRFAAALWEALQRGLTADETEPVAGVGAAGRATSRRAPPFRLDPLVVARLAVLKEWRGKKGKELGLEPGVIAPQRDLELLATSPPPTVAALLDDQGIWASIRPWRRREFGAEWLALPAAVAP